MINEFRACRVLDYRIKYGPAKHIDGKFIKQSSPVYSIVTATNDV